MTAEKICVVCGADCATLPRLKDSQGRYACKTCVEAKRRAATGDKAMPKASPAPKPRPAASAAGGASAGFSMDAYLDGIHTPDANPCPKCGAGRAADAVVCMQCGFDSASGRAMTTKVGKDKPKRTRSSAPRVSSGMVCVIIALAMLGVLPLLAMSSPEGTGVALLIGVIWNLVAYAYMVGSAFRDDDKFWGILGVLFWVPLVGGLCWLAFVLYYCTIGSQRGVRKVNYWASWFALMIVLAIFASNNPDMFSGGATAP
ncbi:MAG: hypothetical protein ACIAQU_02845 [Phycisphaerales bacterium JB064]